LVVPATFKLRSAYAPCGDQPRAIADLASHRPDISTLMGVTGSGKTFTIANVIAQQHKPVLVLSPNKTLAAQLYEEFSLFFPENKVCYFVSYYDYYQPESYVPSQDLYIAKETRINSEIERLRIEATASLVNRPDTIVIASVSCIYSLGNPTDYKQLALRLQVGQTISRADLLRQLVDIQYERNEIERNAGTVQAVGATIFVNLPYQKETLSIELFGSRIEALTWIDRQNRTVLTSLDNTVIFPAKHFVTTAEKKEKALKSIQKELEDTLASMTNPLYKDRLAMRVNHDMELLAATGFCPGIENYSSHFDGRLPGQPPYCLLDFFDDCLLVIDESHIALPQLRAMYAGDQARKKNLIEFGFRLPSALDNRPLQFSEIERFFNDVIFVSATPGDYEQAQSSHMVEQVIRPTGLVDPVVELHPRQGQLDHLMAQIRHTTQQGYRSLITVLTKQGAEDVARYLEERKFKVCYLHSDLKTPQRTELLHKLRSGVFDCLVGVNLLREGLDLPEVALVAIMDADMESYLRDKRSLIQIIGRAARNVDARVVLYADTITASMKGALDETSRRRALQLAYNQEHGIVPRSASREVTKAISPLQKAILAAQKTTAKERKKEEKKIVPTKEMLARIEQLEMQMDQAAQALDFEKAIALRQEWRELKSQIGEDPFV
jgi:excinuclease ABC subunit B